MPYASSILQRKFGLGQQHDPDALKYFSTAGITAGNSTPTAYDNAASFNGSNQYLIVANNSTLQLASSDITISGWFFATSNANAYNFIFAKWNTSWDYGLYLNASSNLVFQTSAAAFTVATGVALNKWNHFSLTLTTTGSVQFYLNGSSVFSTTGAAISNSTASLALARQGDSNASYFTGYISGLGIWKSAAGVGGALSSAQIISLYNNGIGLTYAGIQNAGLTTNLVSYWALNQTSVTADSAGTNTLTNNNSVTASVVGPIATAFASSRQLINSFVKGVKGLGLWSSMVCWPLRSSQNASSTLTANSLGGLGTYNGTLTGVGSSSYLSTGLNLSGICSITGTIPAINSQYSIISINKWNALSTDYLDFNASSSGNIHNPYSNNSFYLNTPSGSQISVASGLSAGLIGMSAYYAGSTSYIFLNSNQLTSGITTVGTASQASGSYLSQGSGGSRVASFLMFINSNQYLNNSNLYSLYKSTLGQGLSLP